MYKDPMHFNPQEYKSGLYSFKCWLLKNCKNKQPVYLGPSKWHQAYADTDLWLTLKTCGTWRVASLPPQMTFLLRPKATGSQVSCFMSKVTSNYQYHCACMEDDFPDTSTLCTIVSFSYNLLTTSSKCKSSLYYL